MDRNNNQDGKDHQLSISQQTRKRKRVDDGDSGPSNTLLISPRSHSIKAKVKTEKTDAKYRIIQKSEVKNVAKKSALIVKFSRVPAENTSLRAVVAEDTSPRTIFDKKTSPRAVVAEDTSPRTIVDKKTSSRNVSKKSALPSYIDDPKPSPSPTTRESCRVVKEPQHFKDFLKNEPKVKKALQLLHDDNDEETMTPKRVAMIRASSNIDEPDTPSRSKISGRMLKKHQPYQVPIELRKRAAIKKEKGDTVIILKKEPGEGLKKNAAKMKRRPKLLKNPMNSLPSSRVSKMTVVQDNQEDNTEDPQAQQVKAQGEAFLKWFMNPNPPILSPHLLFGSGSGNEKFQILAKRTCTKTGKVEYLI